MNSINVLIVDDDIVDRENIKRILRRGNISADITEVSTGHEALVQLNDAPFDAVLLDYNLPQRNGLEMLLEIKANRKRWNVAVIMMSTSEEDEIALSCINAGAQDFLIKHEINAFRLQRAIANAQARSDLEEQLFQSYQQSKELAEHDSLTGLANRYFFDDSFSKDIKSHKRDKANLSLLLIDLDNFKFVNDNYGHDVGDKLLIEVVKRIKLCLRDSELFSRLGGDEFAITLTRIKSTSDISRVAQRILEALNEPFDIDGYKIQSSASIGISAFPHDSKDPTELFKFADIAMYRAKSLGRNQFSFFKEEMQKEFFSRFLIESKLKGALANDDFSLNYQPVIDVNSNKVIGAEALIRWSIDGEAIPPDKFIPIAESSRMIIEIGRWVIKTAIKQISDWNSKKTTPLNMAINLSPVQLSDKGLISFISDLLETYNVKAELVEFELTETALIGEPEKSEKIIKRISELGCLVSLDDFGTGFSSLSHLHSFPIDIVKIDKSLMPNASSTIKVKKLLSGIVVMLKSLDMKVIAEGVETKVDLSLCNKLEVDRMQGYYFDKPLTADEFTAKYLNSLT